MRRRHARHLNRLSPHVFAEVVNLGADVFGAVCALGIVYHANSRLVVLINFALEGSSNLVYSRHVLTDFVY